MKIETKCALTGALKSYAISILIAILISGAVFVFSGNLLAAITILLALLLGGFRFFYLDYQIAKRNYLNKIQVKKVT